MMQFSTRTILIFILFLSGYGQGFAQDPVASSAPYKWALKLSPTAVLDFTPSFQLGVEYQTSNDQSAVLELGYIFDLLNSTDDGFQGFKLRGEYRFYRPEFSKQGHLRYWGLHYLHKRVSVDEDIWVRRNNGNFRQLLPGKISNVTNSFYFVMGRQYKVSERFRLESVLGIGARRLDISYKDLPEDATTFNDGVSFFEIFDLFDELGPGTHITPAGICTMKLIYIIK